MTGKLPHCQIPKSPHYRTARSTCSNSRKSRKSCRRQIPAFSLHSALVASYRKSRSSRLRYVTANRATCKSNRYFHPQSYSGRNFDVRPVLRKELCKKKNPVVGNVFQTPGINFLVFWILAKFGRGRVNFTRIQGTITIVLRPPTDFSPIRTLYPGQNQ